MASEASTRAGLDRWRERKHLIAVEAGGGPVRYSRPGGLFRKGYTMTPRPRISYAQNGEDILLDRALGHLAQGFYVDVGAHDPVANSVTMHFHKLGWHGINIEPGDIFGALARARPGDVNLQVAISDHDGTATLFVSPEATALSSLVEHPSDATEIGEARFEEFYATREPRSVPCLTLRTVLERHAEGLEIAFLKVDVEGHERAVLAGNDWSRFRPMVVVVEATRPMTSIPSWDEWEPILIQAEYQFAFFDGLNRYYVRKESAELLAAFDRPANVADGFTSWLVLREAEETNRLRAENAALRWELARERQALNSVQGTGTLGLPLALFLARQVHRAWCVVRRLPGIRAR